MHKCLIKSSLKEGKKCVLILLICLWILGVGCTLTWSKRMKIALDAAKGLAFLHGAERSIIYRDFKTSNILLDGVSCHCFDIHDLHLNILHIVIRVILIVFLVYSSIKNTYVGAVSCL